MKSDTELHRVIRCRFSSEESNSKQRYFRWSGRFRACVLRDHTPRPLPVPERHLNTVLSVVQDRTSRNSTGEILCDGVRRRGCVMSLTRSSHVALVTGGDREATVPSRWLPSSVSVPARLIRTRPFVGGERFSTSFENSG